MSLTQSPTELSKTGGATSQELPAMSLTELLRELPAVSLTQSPTELACLCHDGHRLSLAARLLLL